MQCPGQDTRFWKPDDIFDIPCQACGAAVEFFKSDTRRRCPRCGKRIQNPRISLGCAQWCAHAKECLGFDPKALDLADSAELSLTDQLAAALRQSFADDPAAATRSLLVLDEAQDLMRREGGDPRVIMAASLMQEFGVQAARAGVGPRTCAGERPVRGILEGLGFEAGVIDQVWAVVTAAHGPEDPGTVEGRVVQDAVRLNRMGDQLRQAVAPASAEEWAAPWRTAAGRDRAGGLRQAPGSGAAVPVAG